MRSPSRTTAKLIEIMTPLTNLGVPVDHAMIRAAPPFPVAGFSWFTDDWMFPRYVPTPHLHEGTDIFAESGTPIVASGPGHVAALNQTPVGGIVAWVVGDDGNTFYYAHLLAYADGLQAGQRVDAGTVIGYVGNSGNAITTSPHLHFEIHPAIRDRRGGIIQAGVTLGPTGWAHSNTPATNPKPYLDAWLIDAEQRAQALVLALVQRLAGLTRQIHFSRRVDDLVRIDTATSPRELMWFAALDPTLGALGLVREAAFQTGHDRARTAAARSAIDQQTATIRLALDAPAIKFASLTGGLARF